MSSDVQPGSGPKDRDRGPALMAILWTETGIAGAFVILRFYARGIIHRIGWDDWLMLLTWVLFIASTVCAGLQNGVGGYRHAEYLSQDALTKALELNFFLRALNILSLAAGKAAVGAFILRLLGRQRVWQRWVVWGIIIFTVLVNVLNTIFNFVQCQPIAANWDHNIKGKCWDKVSQLDFAYFMSSENILADAVLAIIPATFIFRLNMSLKRRVSLSVLLGLSSMAAICGIIKTIELDSIVNDPDFTWGEYALTVWSMSEVFIIVLCGTAPALKPLWDRYIVRKSMEEIVTPNSGGSLPESYRMRNMDGGSSGIRRTTIIEVTRSDASGRKSCHNSSH